MEVNAANLRNLSFMVETRWATALRAAPITDFSDLMGEIPGVLGKETIKVGLGGLFATMRDWVGERVIQSLAAWIQQAQNVPREMTLGILENDILYDNYNLLMSQVEGMAAEVGVDLRNRIVAALITPSVAAAATGGQAWTQNLFDTVPLFSASHVYPGSSVAAQANCGTETFSKTAYYAVRAKFKKYLRPNGLIFPQFQQQPTHLFHALNIQPTVDATFKMMLTAGTAEVAAAGNPLWSEFDHANIRAVPEFPDNAWLITTDKRAVKPIAWGNARAPRFIPKVNPETSDEAFMKGLFTFGFDTLNAVFPVAWWDWYYSDGSVSVG